MRLSKKDDLNHKALRAARALLMRALAMYSPDMVGSEAGKALMLDICKWDEATFACESAPSKDSAVLEEL